MPHPLAEIEQARKEWVAWRIICQVLEREHGVSINETPRLHAALVRWGEELAHLREWQDSDARDQWLVEAREKCDNLDVRFDIDE